MNYKLKKFVFYHKRFRFIFRRYNIKTLMTVKLGSTYQVCNKSVHTNNKVIVYRLKFNLI